MTTLAQTLDLFSSNFNLRRLFPRVTFEQDAASVKARASNYNEKTPQVDEDNLVSFTSGVIGDKAPYSIRIARSSEDLQRLYEFRYRISVEEMSREVELADHKNKILKDKYDEAAINIIATRNGEIVGCGRLNFSESTSLPHREFFKLDQMESDGKNNICWASKLMIDPRFRGSLLMFNIVRAFCEITHRKGVTISALGCNLSVQPYFEKLGWKVYGSAVDYKNYGVSVPMMFDHKNIEYLEEIHSPLTRHCKVLQNLVY